MCCDHSKEIEVLTRQLAIARSELKNLREKILSLKKAKNTALNKTENFSKSEKRKPGESYQPIGIIKTTFESKRGIPRQSNLGISLMGCLTLDTKYITNTGHAVEGLDNFSHAWLIYHFHNTDSKHFQTKVSPPRLNGSKTGVFSTRSPHRPNSIGLSLVKLHQIQDNKIFFYGVDMQDGTPVWDIKPFIPAYDFPREEEVKIPDWLLKKEREQLKVEFAENVEHKLDEKVKENIIGLLKEDPRSNYLKKFLGDSIYKMVFEGLEISAIFNNNEKVVRIVDVH